MQRLAWLALSFMVNAGVCAADGISDSRRQALSNLLIQDCGSCHGLTRQGGLGPPLLADKLSSRSPDYLTAIILHGRPGSAMPAWQPLLTPAEARWIAERLLEEPSP